MSLFNDKINQILEKTDLDANELRPGDICLNNNKECNHFGSKGKVLKVFKIKEPNNTIGKFVRYEVLNDGPTFKKGDILDKTEIQLKKLNENYADGKKKGKSRPGRVKRSGASCKGSVTSLRAKAKKAGGEKGKMYHWCANMKGGKKKK